MDKIKNILLAKKYIVESIYSSVKIEGLALTFPETASIMENEGITKKDYTYDDVNFVNDLKHAWQFLFNSIDEPISFSLIKELHLNAGLHTVVNAGSVRRLWDEPIRVKGEHGETVYIPPFPPKESIIENDIQFRCNISDKVDCALELYMYLAKSQLFNDGNKRIAGLVCNMVLIQNGKGLFIVPVESDLDFKRRLVKYYVDDDKDSFKQYLRETCLFQPKEFTIGQKIQMLRENENLDRTELSAKLNITENELLQIEKDKVIPSEKLLNQIADYFEIDKESLIEYELDNSSSTDTVNDELLPAPDSGRK